MKERFIDENAVSVFDPAFSRIGHVIPDFIAFFRFLFTWAVQEICLHDAVLHETH
jgi:hypothetical protein